MKILALILVVIGTGLAAASGSRNIDDIVERQRLAAEGTNAAERVEQARVAYCDAREDAGLGGGDGCGGAALEAIQPDLRDAGEDEAGLRAVGRERTRELKATRPDVLPSQVAQKREAWIQLYEETLGARAAGEARVQLPGPGARLSAWASLTGLWFALGLILVITGAVMARVVIRREVTQPDEAASDEGSSGSPDTFDKTLGELLAGVQAVAVRLAEVTDPGAPDFDAAQLEVERLQLDCIEPLVAARARIQTLHGMAAFAAIFGPLSAGERNLNRVWSALVDRHWPEATRSAEVACYGLEEATEELQRVRSSEA